MAVDLIVDMEVSNLQPFDDEGLIPALTEDEYAGLLADIRARGVQNPLAVLPDGITVVDGKHRLRAAVELGLDVVPCRTVSETAIPHVDNVRPFVLEYMVRDVVHRRHLSNDARTGLIAKLLAESRSSECETRKGAKRPKLENFDTPRTAKTQGPPEGGGDGDLLGTGPQYGHSPKEKSVTLKSGRTLSTREAAKEFGVSPKTIRKAQKMKAAVTEDPSLAGKPVNAILREAKEKGATKEDREKASVKERIRALADLCSTCDLFPCEKLKAFLDEVERAACGRPEHARREERTPVQRIVNRYKVLKGAPADDVGWDQKFFPAFIRPAKELLDKCDADEARAIRILEAAARYFQQNRLSWTLHTVVKPHILSELYTKEVSNGDRGRKYPTDLGPDTPDDEV